MTELTWQRKIGEILLERNIVTAKQLEEALKIQEMILKPIGKILVDMEVTTEEQIAEALAEQRGFSRISIKDYKINKQAINLFPMPMARLHKALPIDFEEEKIILAMADPLDVYAIDDVRMITGREIQPVVCTESEILEIIDSLMSGVVKSSEEDVLQTLKEKAEEIKTNLQDNVAALVDEVIELSAQKGVSEIFIEPQDQCSQIRLRLNGDMHDFLTVNKEDHPTLVTCVKKLLGVDTKEMIFEKAKQTIEIEDTKLDITASFLPGVFGEDISLKIYCVGEEPKELEDMGLRWKALADVKTAIANRSGLVLGVQVLSDRKTGRTATSFLYTIPQMLASSRKRVITVEDRIQRKLKGVVQVETSPEKTTPFSVTQVLPAILVSNPDVLSVSDIAEKESGELLVKAALNGTLVLATIQGQDSIRGLSRLLEMGLSPLMVAEALKCVVSYKSVKRLCCACRKEYRPKSETIDMLTEKAGFQIEPPAGKSYYTADGCDQCDDSGFSGAIGIFETLPVSKSLQEAIIDGKSVEEIKDIAEKEGTLSLSIDAYHKALQGEISFEELVKQIG